MNGYHVKILQEPIHGRMCGFTNLPDRRMLYVILFYICIHMCVLCVCVLVYSVCCIHILHVIHVICVYVCICSIHVICVYSIHVICVYV